MCSRNPTIGEGFLSHPVDQLSSQTSHGTARGVARGVVWLSLARWEVPSRGPQEDDCLTSPTMGLVIRVFIGRACYEAGFEQGYPRNTPTAHTGIDNVGNAK